MTASGRLITVEGGEGSGKSTQVQRLAACLVEHGLHVLVTREPGGTPEAEAIRQLLLGGTPERWTPLAETLLLLAARHDHVARRIEPALRDGTWVVCDRFSDSTRVYQGIAGSVGLDRVDRLHSLVLGDLRPDLTLILDVPVAIGLARRRASVGANRYERMDDAFHERVRDGFLAIARAEPGRCVVIDGTAPPDVVAERIIAAARARFGLSRSG